MKLKADMEGTGDAVEALNKRLRRIKNMSVGALLAGGMVILRGAQKRVPVEYGKLRASGYAKRSQDDPRAVDVGFTEQYGLFVHENTEQVLAGVKRKSGLGVYWGPHGAGPKFLTRSVEEDGDKAFSATAKHAGKKGV